MKEYANKDLLQLELFKPYIHCIKTNTVFEVVSHKFVQSYNNKEVKFVF